MLEGKRIVVTGASRGIGQAIARACLTAGAQVVGVNYLTSQEAAESLRAEAPDKVRLLPFDVRDPEAVSAAVASFAESEGGIDGWVNNAGVNLPDLLVAARDDRIRQQVDVNLLGPLWCSREALQVMMRQRSGVLINVGSVAAPRPGRGQAVYAATKGALEALTRSIALEYGRKGIRAHCLRPGPVETDMFAATKELAGEDIKKRIPLRRYGQPQDVAELAVFLLSDRANWMSGGTHDVAGGYHLG